MASNPEEVSVSPARRRIGVGRNSKQNSTDAKVNNGHSTRAAGCGRGDTGPDGLREGDGVGAGHCERRHGGSGKDVPDRRP